MRLSVAQPSDRRSRDARPLAALRAPVKKRPVGPIELPVRPVRLLPVRRADEAASLPARPAELSPRELAVLRLIAAGKTTREMASELFISVATVERHITHLYGKIDARGRADATAYAFRHGLVGGAGF